MKKIYNLKKIKKIHFVGIGGIGISAIAKMMMKEGKKVSGTDLVISEIAEELKAKGAKFYKGHNARYLGKDTDLVIYSPAVPKGNPERKKARKLKIPELSYPEVLGILSRGKRTIAVSGTNGKTTTTAFSGLMLEAAGFDPTVIVGSKVKTFKEGNLRMGKGKYFVVEGCEWRAHMLNLLPYGIVLTNIEEDHLDYYRDLNHIIKTFEEYIQKLPKDGFLVLNADDPVSRRLKFPNVKVLTYGIKNKAQLVARNIKVKKEKQLFDLVRDGKKLGAFSVFVPGRFNIYNALAASSMALELGVSVDTIKKVLEGFPGTWRRFERIGKRGGAQIILDYAHHPTAIRETIRATKEFYPKKRILVVFQPHQHSRTKKLFYDFISSFDEADLIILSEIFDVVGREKEKDRNISSKDLIRELIKRYRDRAIEKKVLYAKDLDETKKLVLKNFKKNDVVLIMGAGDIYKIGEELVRK